MNDDYEDCVQNRVTSQFDQLADSMDQTARRAQTGAQVQIAKFRLKNVEITKVEWKNAKLMTGHRSYQIRCIVSHGQQQESMEEEYEVWRRFQDFDSLCLQLQQTHAGCIVPPLPDKSVKDKIVEDDSKFVDDRRQGLLRFLKRLARHRVLGQSDEFIEFVRDQRFYHHDSGSTGVSRSIKSLWNQGKSWSPFKRFMSTGSPNSDIPSLDTQIEDDYQREVATGSKILADRLYNLMLTLQAQMATFSKQTNSLQQLNNLLFSGPMPQDEQTAQSVDCSSFDQQQVKAEEKLPAQFMDLRQIHQRSHDLLSLYRDGLLSDASFYYRYVLSLQVSVENRQARVDALYANQQKSIRKSGAGLQTEAEKLRDMARGLLCEFQDLSSEIQISLINNVAALGVKYAE